MTALEVIADELNAPVSADAVLDDLAIDSLEYIELVRRLEEEFDIRLEDEILKHVVTIRDLCGVVDRLRTANANLAAHVSG